MGRIPEHIPAEVEMELVDSCDMLRAGSRPPEERRADGVAPHPVVGTIKGFDGNWTLVTVPALLDGGLLRARSTSALSCEHIGASVLIVCEEADPRRPVVIGVIQRPAQRVLEAVAPATISAQECAERLEIRADREIVLRCGDASITLTRAGKVLIQGTYVASRSSGYNKLKGAVVDIN